MIEMQAVALTDFFALDYCGRRQFRLSASIFPFKFSGASPMFLIFPEWSEGVMWVLSLQLDVSF